MTVTRAGIGNRIHKFLSAQNIKFPSAMSSIKGCKPRDHEVIVTGNVSVMQANKKTRPRQEVRKISLSTALPPS